MRKLLTIAWKDLILAFRDPSALIIMLVTPFALTLVMAFAFGGLRGRGSGMTDIPVVIVNHDTGEFGKILVQAFESQDLADLLEPKAMTDDAAARASVDTQKAAAAVIIPADFSQSIMPAGGAAATSRPQSVVEVYRDPTRSISAGVVRGIVDQFVSRMAAASASGQVAVVQLLANGLISPQQAMPQGQEIGSRAAQQVVNAKPVSIRGEMADKAQQTGFDWLTYMAPSMAIMFLMFTVSNGGRSILAERDWGTLPRLLTTPTTPAQVIGGKVGGIFLTGVAQMAILIAASGLLFRVRWGSVAGVVVLTLALVAAATGWGALLASYSRSAAQAGQLGSMLALVFGMLAGNFFPRQALPQWLRTASYVSPNAWGLEGFISLTGGGTLSDVLLPATALLIMAGVLFAAATMAFRRQYA